jgi:hypothetical protein
MTASSEHPFEDLFERARDPAFILDPIADRIVAGEREGVGCPGLSGEPDLEVPPG